MNETEYIEQRLDDQINWYSSKSLACQNSYKTLRLIEIVAAAFIPLLSGMGEKILYGTWIIGLLGATIAIVTASIGLFKYHENWIHYRAIAEQLKQEKYFFLTQSAHYANQDRFKILVQRVEGYVTKENLTWQETVKSGSKATSDQS